MNERFVQNNGVAGYTPVTTNYSQFLTCIKKSFCISIEATPAMTHFVFLITVMRYAFDSTKLHNVWNIVHKNFLELTLSTVGSL